MTPQQSNYSRGNFSLNQVQRLQEQSNPSTALLSWSALIFAFWAPSGFKQCISLSSCWKRNFSAGEDTHMLHCRHKAVPPLECGTSPTGTKAGAWGHPGVGSPS